MRPIVQVFIALPDAATLAVAGSAKDFGGFASASVHRAPAPSESSSAADAIRHPDRRARLSIHRPPMGWLAWMFACSVAAQASNAAPRLEARVEVAHGRAALVLRDGVRPIAPREGGVLVRGGGELELAADARAEVRFAALGSVRLRGGGDLRWVDDDSGVPTWRVGACDELYFELRAAPLNLELDGGWVARIERPCAGALRRLGAAAVVLTLDAGEPIAFERWSADPRHAKRVVVAAGGRATLSTEPRDRAHEQRVRAVAPAVEPWRSFAWPWREREWGAGELDPRPGATQPPPRAATDPR